MSSNSKRHIIDDDDDDDKDDKDIDTGKNTIMRMLRHTKKKKKVTLTRSKSTSPTITAIPKQPKKPDEIPKKARASEDVSSKSSLLLTGGATEGGPKMTLLTQSMLQAPPLLLLGTTSTAAQPATTSTTTATTTGKLGGSSYRDARRGTSSNNNNNNKHGTKSPAENMMRSSGQQLSPVRMDPWDQIPTTATTPVVAAPLLSDEEKRVMSTLRTLCTKVPLRLTPSSDLLSGSFLKNDLDPIMVLEDESPITGDVVFSARIPIFPEDFVDSSQLEWPLSWWGIVDPLVTKKDDRTKSNGSAKKSLSERPDNDRERGGGSQRGGRHGGGADRSAADQMAADRMAADRNGHGGDRGGDRHGRMAAGGGDRHMADGGDRHMVDRDRHMAGDRRGGGPPHLDNGNDRFPGGPPLRGPDHPNGLSSGDWRPHRNNVRRGGLHRDDRRPPQGDRGPPRRGPRY